jgi:hypothetical protein
MLDLERSDFSVFYFHRRGVFPFVVNVMVTVLFELIADQLLPIVMVLRLNHHCDRGSTHNQQPESGNGGKEISR